MTTLTQCLQKLTKKKKKQPLSRTSRLRNCPFGKGLVVRACTMSPKKPNSAVRRVAKVKLNRKPRVTARIVGYNTNLSKFNRVLVRGGRANDLPGVGYSVVRAKYDCSPLFTKKKSRSFYGVRRPDSIKKYIRKKIRRERLKHMS
jgi:small subunit ribosomal protein S12